MNTEVVGAGVQKPRFMGTDQSSSAARPSWQVRSSFRKLLKHAQSTQGVRSEPSRPGSTPAARAPADIGRIVAQAAGKYGLDPALVTGVIETESGFDPRAVSSAGAKGLMQLMDGTARGLGVKDPFDPMENVLGGARLLRQLLDRYRGDVRLALAAYNAGAGAVDAHGGIPPYGETQRFVPRVLAASERYGYRSPQPQGTSG